MSFYEEIISNYKKFHDNERDIKRINCENCKRWLMEYIRTESAQGKSFVRFVPKNRFKGLNSWDIVPFLLKDKTFEKFKISPTNPDCDEDEVTISWT